MLVNFNSNIGFMAKKRNLIPLALYKGPILKLTADELAEIEALQKQIIDYEQQMYDIEKCLNKKSLTAELRSFYRDKNNDLANTISFLNKKIQKIKSNRYNIQKQMENS